MPHATNLRVGDQVIVGRDCMGNEAGSLALCVDVYEIGSRPGYMLIFPNGNHDGFSPKDLGIFEVQYVRHLADFETFNFTNVGMLASKFRRGDFASAFVKLFVIFILSMITIS